MAYWHLLVNERALETQERGKGDVKPGWLQGEHTMEGGKGSVRFVASAYGSNIRGSCAANPSFASRLHADGS